MPALKVGDIIEAKVPEAQRSRLIAQRSSRVLFSPSHRHDVRPVVDRIRADVGAILTGPQAHKLFETTRSSRWT